MYSSQILLQSLMFEVESQRITPQRKYVYYRTLRSLSEITHGKGQVCLDHHGDDANRTNDDDAIAVEG